MNKYSDPEAPREKSSIPQPHPDWPENVKFFNLQMGRCRWLPNAKECPVRYEVHDCDTVSVINPETGKREMAKKVKEYMYVLFIYPKGNETTTTNISFHQPSRKRDRYPGFKEELSALLNHFGGKGYLENTVKNNDGSFRNVSRAPVITDDIDQDNPWSKLFGKSK